MLTGYSGAGKTTILTALGKCDDVSDEDVKIRTTGFIRYHIEYETNDGEKLYIRSDDSEGLTKTVNDEEFEKRLKAHHYILYLLNVNEFVNGRDKSKNDRCLAWLQEVNKFAKKNNKTMLLVLTHADEYLNSVGEEYYESNKAIIRDAFLGDKGYLSEVKYSCEAMVANVQKYNEVREIIEKLIRMKN